MQTYAGYRGYYARPVDFKRRVALGVAAILAALLLFDFNSSGVFAKILSPDPAMGWSGQEFSLREAPRVSSGRLKAVKPGERFQLVDSAGGEVLDPKSSSPAKWYFVRSLDSGAEGWAYSAWIRR
jgi:hypothetical protein